MKSYLEREIFILDKVNMKSLILQMKHEHIENKIARCRCRCRHLKKGQTTNYVTTKLTQFQTSSDFEEDKEQRGLSTSSQPNNFIISSPQACAVPSFH